MYDRQSLRGGKTNQTCRKSPTGGEAIQPLLPGTLPTIHFSAGVDDRPKGKGKGLESKNQ